MKLHSAEGRPGRVYQRAIGLGLGLAGAVGLLGSGAGEALAASDRPVSPKVLREIDSLEEARAVFCGAPNNTCAVDEAVFSVRTLRSGEKRAWIQTQTASGTVALRLRTIVGRVAGGNNNLFVSPHNSRVGFNIFTIKGLRDSSSLLFSEKSLVSGRGREVGLVGRMPIDSPRGVVARSSVIEGQYNPPLTHELDPAKIIRVANTLGARVVFGATAKPRP